MLATQRIVVAVALAGCATAVPSRELVDARIAYREAADSPAKDLVPEKLLEARQALDSAESKFRDEKNSPLSRAFAYISHRRALAVVAAAGVAAALESRKAAEREYEELLEVSVKRSRDKLGKTEKTLEQTRIELEHQEKELREKKSKLKAKENELQQEKAARRDVEQRLAAAMKSLEEVAKVNEDARGTIITLSGAVLFKTNESTLLPIAERQLRKVAEALDAYEEGRNIVVAGHTDSLGLATANQKLSLARAESVRAFLVQNGVAADRIRAVGKGKDEPIAENNTPEGRANNRRVEVIIEATATANQTGERATD